MKILAGLGNPESKYADTRHNAGFMAIERIDSSSMGWKEQHKALVKKIRIAGNDVLLAMPQTYMNLSGESLGALARYYKVPSQDLIVFVDDVNLDLGRIRIRTEGSAGGQNGLKNIIQHLGNEFPRIRLGVGPAPSGRELSSFVLGKFSKKEKETFNGVLDQIPDLVEILFQEGVQKAMNRFNS